MNIYVASGSTELDMADAWMKRCREIGFVVTATWPEVITKQGAPNPLDASHEQRRGWAETDAKEVDVAHILWLQVPEKKSEGAFWETGFATGLGLYVVVSGAHYKRSIFTALADEIHDTHEAAFNSIKAHLEAGELPR